MKNRASLSLMEQLIMVLVFALAAALCLQGFAAANRVSQKTGQMDHAVHQVQYAAALLKARRGSVERQLPAPPRPTAGGWVVYYDREWQPVEKTADPLYCMEITRQAPEQKGLGQANIKMLEISRQSELFSLTVAWQEEAV